MLRFPSSSDEEKSVVISPTVPPKPLRLIKAMLFNFSPEISLQVGLEVQYDQGNDEVMLEIGGKLYGPKRPYSIPLNLDQIKDLLENADKYHEFLMKIAPIDFNAALKMHSYQSVINKFIDQLLFSKREVVDDMEHLRYTCKINGKNLKQIVGQPRISDLAYELATNLEDFFESYCRNEL